MATYAWSPMADGGTDATLELDVNFLVFSLHLCQKGET